MFNNKGLKRLEKELIDINQNSELNAQVNAHSVNDDLTQWKGYIKGPVGTPYEGGNFILDITIPLAYPYVAPKIKFDTKIWHPNISSQTGAICLDILKNEWSPAFTIRTALLSIQALLSSPEPGDPQDGEVARMYKTSYTAFVQTARMWVDMFARNQDESHEAKLKKLTEMGFTTAQAQEALKSHSWNENVAVDALLGS